MSGFVDKLQRRFSVQKDKKGSDGSSGSPIELYLDPCTINSRKVLAGCQLMNVKYHLHHIDFFAGQQKSEDFLKINPHATVPAAKDGDLVLTESNAILQYVADVAESKHYPKDLKVRADVNRWLLWEASVWFGTNYIYVVENVVKPLLKAEPDQSVLDNEAPKWNKNAKILDDALAKNKWICGNEVTLADIAVGAPVHLHAASKLPLGNYPNINRWLKDLEALPAWKDTQGAVDKALLPNQGGQEVKATFNYTKDVSPKLTELYFYETEKANGIHEPGDDPHVMPVKDGWGLADTFNVDKHGFALRDFKSSYDDWEDDDNVKNQFYPEVVEFLKKTVGAKRVLVFDHTIRTEGNSKKKLTQETNTSQRSPVMLVHCDYTAESGPVRVKQLLPDEADELLKSRVSFVNVWKPIRRVVEERPLAMCDVTSSPTDDFFKLHLRYRDRNGENYVMRHNDKHQWYYFPKITPEQVILLKTYDSSPDVAKFVGHSAFEDPTSAKDAPFRESVEIRTIAFF